MAFDFPATPSVGTIYAPAGGPTYRWDGEKWQIVGDATLYQRKTADTRNRLLNPAMQISQENGDNVSATASSIGYFAADQWNGLVSASPATANFARSGANLIDFTNYKFLRANVVTATFPLGAADYLTFNQPLEGNQVDDLMWGTPDAKQIILRFMARSTLTGKACVALRKGDVNRSYVADFMLPAPANTWKLVELVIPGDTVAPSWATGAAVGMYLNISFALGSNNWGVLGWQSGSKLGVSGMSNPLQTNGAQVCIGMAGLYADPDKTGIAPPFEAPILSDEMRRCQRYWQKWYGTVIETSGLSDTLIGPAPMRGTPTVSGGGAGFAAPVNNMANAVPTIQLYQTTRAYADITMSARM